MLLTGADESDIREAVVRHARIPFIALPPEMEGIAALKALIARCDLLICNDSGPRHIAVAFKKPVVCLMGPTSPAYTRGPYETGTVLRVDLECSPCQKPVCPLGHHRCMRDITPDQVVDAAAALLPAYQGYS